MITKRFNFDEKAHRDICTGTIKIRSFCIVERASSFPLTEWEFFAALLFTTRFSSQFLLKEGTH